MNVASSWLNKLNILLACLLLLMLILIPLALILVQSFTPDGHWDWLAPLQTISERNLLQVFINSLLLGILVVFGASLFAAPMAFFMAKTTMQRHWWLELLLLIPFMTPPYIGSMGWILFMQPKGYLDQLLPWLSFTQPYFYSLAGIVLIMSLHLFPFIYLIMRNSLIKVGGSLEEAGAIHGGGFLYRLRRIVFPLIFSSYTMGALLIFVKTISEFGTPATLGKRVGFYVLTTEIHRFTSQWPIDFGKAAALSSILLGTSMLIWYCQHLLATKYQVNLVSGRGQKQMVYSLGKYTPLAWLYTIGLLVLAIGVPYFSIFSASLMKLWGYGLRLDNLTWEYYQHIFTLGTEGNRALLNSLKLASFSATLALIIGTFLSLTIVRSTGWMKKSIDVSSLLSNTVPGIVIIVGLILFWNAPWMKWTVYNTPYMLIVTYTVLFLPYSVQYVKANLEQISPSLFQAARVSGASRFYMFRRILLPLIKPGILAGWMMTFIISIRELVGSLMIRPPGMETTATFIYGQFEQGNASLGMAMAICSVGITTIILLFLHRYQQRM